VNDTRWETNPEFHSGNENSGSVPSATDHIGHNHIDHRENILLLNLASVFNSYPFEMRNVVCNHPVSRDIVRKIWGKTWGRREEDLRKMQWRRHTRCVPRVRTHPLWGKYIIFFHTISQWFIRKTWRSYVKVKQYEVTNHGTAQYLFYVFQIIKFYRSQLL